MKYALLAILLLSACKAANGSQPPAAPAPSIGFVDMDRVQRESQTSAKAANALQTDTQRWNAEIEQANQATAKLEADKKAKPDDVKSARTKAQQLAQSYQAQHQQRMNADVAALIKRADQEAEKLRTERKLDAIVTGHAMSAASGLDLTAEIVRRIDGVPTPDEASALREEVAALRKQVSEMAKIKEPGAAPKP